jgi:hypothetical protein
MKTFLLRRRPAPATVIALLALFVGLGGPAKAAHLISGSDIRAATITTREVKNRGLWYRDLSSHARTRLRTTPDASVGSTQIADGGVATNDIAERAITTKRIKYSAVHKAEIAAGSVGTSELIDGQVTNGKLAPDSVTGAQIADGSLTAADYTDTAGTVAADFPAVPAHECVDSGDLAAPGLRTGETLTDDVLQVTAPAGFPSTLTLTARPSATVGAFVVTACNPTGTDVADPAAANLNVVGLDLG